MTNQHFTKPFPIRPMISAACLTMILASSCHTSIAQQSPPATQPVTATATVHVTIDPSTVLAKITPLSIGVNTSVYDSHLADTVVPSLVKQAGFTVLRYPGGSTSDEYHWQTNTYTPKIPNDPPGKVAAANDFDHFIQLCRASGAEPVITVNYGSNTTRTAGGDPQEAAAWVAYAKQKGDHVHYWEIGNEIYGNGFYGANWETDLHAPQTDESARKGNPLLGPTAYGKNVAAFAQAMKARDKTAQIGAVLAAPLNWPDAVDPDWNTGVLKECGHDIDFAIIHVYPQLNGTESDAGLLTQPAKNAQIIAALRPKLTQYCGKQIPIFVTETNSVNTQPGKQSVSQVNALFAADDVLSFLEAGAANVDWWQLHNGPTTNANNSPQLFGDATYGDYGVLMNGDPPEPAANTPQRTYYGFQMLHKLAEPGDTLMEAASDNPMIAAFASHSDKQGKAIDKIMILNKSATDTFKVRVSRPGGAIEIQDGPTMFESESNKYMPVSFAEYEAPIGRVEWVVPPYSFVLLTVGPASR